MAGDRYDRSRRLNPTRLPDEAAHRQMIPPEYLLQTLTALVLAGTVLKQ
jgi:DNA-binding IscR family transcriptional regulator